MFTMVFISTVAILVGIVGCVVIWGMDALRADEVERPKARPALPALAPTEAKTPAIE